MYVKHTEWVDDLGREKSARGTAVGLSTGRIEAIVVALSGADRGDWCFSTDVPIIQHCVRFQMRWDIWEMLYL